MKRRAFYLKLLILDISRILLWRSSVIARYFFFPLYLKWCLNNFSFKLQEELYYKLDNQ